MNSVQEWSNSLSEHLQFSRESLSVQQSMFETSSNDGAWCYCCMHVYHASTLIALNNVRWNPPCHQCPPTTFFQAQQFLQKTPVLKVGPQWATDMLDQILTMLGDRGKHSLLSEYLSCRDSQFVADFCSVCCIMGKNFRFNSSGVH